MSKVTQDDLDTIDNLDDMVRTLNKLNGQNYYNFEEAVGDNPYLLEAMVNATSEYID